jgi:hypothetical protein
MQKDPRKYSTSFISLHRKEGPFWSVIMGGKPDKKGDDGGNGAVFGD